MGIAIHILESLRYSLYIIFHPFKGFWDLKHEKKGNITSASIIVFILIIVYILRRQLTGYILNYNVSSQMNVLIQITSIILPFLLWCISNWCITTLVDGEGSFKDIIVTTAYALVPLILINIPLLLFSNVITLGEASFYFLFDYVSVIWAVLLMLVGIMTVHQFTMFKAIFSIIIAIIGMIIMIFVFLLFFSLIQQLINFCILIYKEIAMRQ